MPDYTFKSVTISTTAEGASGETFTFATLDTTPGAAEGRTIGTLTVAPDVEVRALGKRVIHVTAITTTGFTVKAADAGDDLPLSANVFVKTFDQVSSVSNAKSSTVSKVRRALDITATNEIVTDTQIQEQIDAAVTQYSKDRPRKKRFEVQGNAEHEYALPSDYVQEFSSIDAIEYPAGQQVPEYIDENEYYVETVDTTQRTTDSISSGATSATFSTVTEAGFFSDGEIVKVGDDDASETNWITANGNTTTGVVTLKNATLNLYDSNPYIQKIDHVRFISIEPLSSEYFVQEYMLPHTHTDSSDTIPTSDLDAVCHLAASFTAKTISAAFAKATSSTFGADNVDQLAKVDAWDTVANEQRKLYRDKLGLDRDSKNPPVQKILDSDAQYTHRRPFLFHSGRVG